MALATESRELSKLSEANLLAGLRTEMRVPKQKQVTFGPPARERRYSFSGSVVSGSRKEVGYPATSKRSQT